MHDRVQTTAPGEAGLPGVIDARPLGAFQIRVVAICAALAFVEGFDAQVAGFVGPALRTAWGLQPAVLGAFFSLGLVGLALGALFLAPWADRLGRKPVILASVAVFGLGSLGMAASPTLPLLFVFRFLTGLGLGGAMPNIIATTSEYAPQRSRSLAVVVMFNGFNLGAIAAGLAALPLLQSYGWRGVFALGGVLPLVLAAVAAAGLPESIRFLATRPERRAQATAILRRIDPGFDGEAPLASGPEARRMDIAELFRAGRARTTLLLWVIFFMSLLDIFFLTTWLPSQVAALGLSLTAAIMVGVVLQVGGVLGLALGWFLDRIGPRATLGISYVVATLSILVIAYAGANLPLLLAGTLGAGFGVLGGQIAANAVAAASYPTEVRSTGVGWSLGIGRIGSIIGPAAAGVLIGMQVSPQNLFLLSAGPALVAAAAAAALRR